MYDQGDSPRQLINMYNFLPPEQLYILLSSSITSSVQVTHSIYNDSIINGKLLNDRLSALAIIMQLLMVINSQIFYFRFNFFALIFILSNLIL